MQSKESYDIVVLPGDGIGPEVMEQAISVMEVAAEQYDVKLTEN